MTTTYTPTYRFPIMTPGDPSVTNQWGNILNEFIQILENAIGNFVQINVGGLTSYTLTAYDNAPDQSRYAMWMFTGALTANCTVTIPAVARIGMAVNSTSGGYEVVLTTGVSGGANLVIPENSTAIYYCDGTNVYLIPSLMIEPASSYNQAVTLGQYFSSQGYNSNSNVTVNSYKNVVYSYGTSPVTLTLGGGTINWQEVVFYSSAGAALTIVSSVSSGSPAFLLPDGSTVYSISLPANNGAGAVAIWDGTNWHFRTFGQTVIAPANADNQAVQLGQLLNGSISPSFGGGTFSGSVAVGAASSSGQAVQLGQITNGSIGANFSSIYTSGLTTTGFLNAGTGVFSNVQGWFSAGTYTFTVPNGVYYVKVLCVGGGGGGGGVSVGVSTDIMTGSGGGGGGTTIGVYSVSPGQQITVTVGGGGPGGGGGANGGAGGASSFGSFTTAGGGGGGAGFSGSSGSIGGASGGTVSGGQLEFDGQSTSGVAVNQQNDNSGGNSVFFGGGATGGVYPTKAWNYGGGGGGGYTSGSSASGTSGAQGCVIVWY